MTRQEVLESPPRKGRLREILVSILLVPVVPLVLAVVFLGILALPLVWVALRLRGAVLRRMFLARHGPRILLVYSNSPHWKIVIEEQWLPRLEETAIVLNWSERSTWPERHRLEQRVFQHWLGDSEFNPGAVVVVERGPIEVLRFWQAFRDFRHGKRHPLLALETRLFELADGIRILRAH